MLNLNSKICPNACSHACSIVYIRWCCSDKLMVSVSACNIIAKCGSSPCPAENCRSLLKADFHLSSQSSFLCCSQVAIETQAHSQLWCSLSAIWHHVWFMHSIFHCCRRNWVMLLPVSLHMHMVFWLLQDTAAVCLLIKLFVYNFFYS